MLTALQTQQVMFKLRCAAEKDPNDVVANACSQLAFELELPARVKRLTDMDRELIRYAARKNYTPTKERV